MDIERSPSKKKSSQEKRKFKSDRKGSNKRFKPYYGSEKEGQGFADLRKKKAAREYLKFLQQERKNDVAKGKDTEEKPPLTLYNILSRSERKHGNGHSFTKAEKVAEEKRKKREEEKEKHLKEKEAKNAAMKAYKTKKKETFLKLCKKTRKGQPVMKNQMEVLLDKIMKHKGIKTDEGAASSSKS